MARGPAFGSQSVLALARSLDLALALSLFLSLCLFVSGCACALAVQDKKHGYGVLFYRNGGVYVAWQTFLVVLAIACFI